MYALYGISLTVRVSDGLFKEAQRLYVHQAA